MIWFYLSFADVDGWRGAAIVEGGDMTSAVRRAWDVGCNPGGEVMGCPCDEPGEGYKDRLLTKDEVILCFGPVGTVKTTGCEHHREIVIDE
jgi:hypothetical protein